MPDIATLSTSDAADLIICADWIVPVVPAKSVLHKHAILVNGRKIVGLIPQNQISRDSSQCTVIELTNHILIPGLVNAHGHSAMSLFRGIADDLPLKEWLETFIWPLESKLLSPEFVQQGARLALAEMICSGTTCFADMYFFPEQVALATLNAGIRVQLATPILEFPTVWARDSDDYIGKALNLHDQYKNNEFIHTAFGPHAPYTVADTALQRVATFAEELDVPIHMHVHETAQEVADGIERNGKRPMQRLSELGLITPRFVGIHATQLNAEEIRLLAENGANVVHCPESNQKLASGSCPVDSLIKAGVNVALGTDGCASNNDLDMFSEMRSAALLGKLVANDASAVPAHEALAMATLNAAKALGLDDDIGSLEVGKQADIAAISCDAMNALPFYNCHSQLVYSTQASQVSHVWCAGRPLLQDHKLLSIDKDGLVAAVKGWQQQVRANV